MNAQITAFLNTVLTLMQALGATLAAISIAWGGLMFIFSEGNSLRAGRAKLAILSALVGLGILLLATAIAGLVTTAVGG